MSDIKRWMPLYVGDYLADTMHLSTLEHGAYLLLLMHYWRTGPIANDDATLQKISGVSPHLWTKSFVGSTIKKFFVVEGGYLIHKRVEAERAKVFAIKEKGVKAAAKRAAGKTENNQIHTAFTPGLLPTPVQVPSKKDKKEESKQANYGTDAARDDGFSQSESEPEPTENQKPKPAKCPPGQKLKRVGVGGDIVPTKTGELSINGWLLDQTWDDIMTAAGLAYPDKPLPRGPVEEWLTDGFHPDDIIAVVKRVASRPGYQKPFSLKFFDRAVRQDCQPKQIDWDTGQFVPIAATAMARVG